MDANGKQLIKKNVRMKQKTNYSLMNMNEEVIKYIKEFGWSVIKRKKTCKVGKTVENESLWSILLKKQWRNQTRRAIISEHYSQLRDKTLANVTNCYNKRTTCTSGTTTTTTSTTTNNQLETTSCLLAPFPHSPIN